MSTLYGLRGLTGLLIALAGPQNIREDERHVARHHSLIAVIFSVASLSPQLH